MKQIVSFLTAMSLLTGICYDGYSQENLVSKQSSDGKWGFVKTDNTHEFVIKPQFDEVLQEFDNGLSCVRDGKHQFFIDKSGSLISGKYTWCDVFDDFGLCKVNVGGKLTDDGDGVSGGSFGFIDRTGNEVIKPKYEFVSDFNNLGVVLVNNGCKISDDGKPEGGKYGYIDRSGNSVVPIEYDFVGEFNENGFCWVNKGGKKFESDKNINATMSTFSAREKNPAKLAAKRNELENEVTGGKRDPFGRKAVGGEYGVYDYTGRVAVAVSYDKIWDIEEGMVRVKGKKGIGFVDVSNAVEVVPCTLIDAAPAYSEGLVWIKKAVDKEQKVGYLDKTGKEVISCKYKKGGDFQNGIAIVSNPPGREKQKVAGMKVNTVTETIKCGLIDAKGNDITGMVYDMIIPKGDLLFCRENGKYCFIRQNGEAITPSVILEAGVFVNGKVRVKVSAADAAVSHKGGPLVSSESTVKDKGKWCLIDSDGTVVSDSYTRMTGPGGGIYSVCDENWGAINESGNVCVPLLYSKVEKGVDGFAAVKSKENKWGFVETGEGKLVVDCEWEEAMPDMYEKVGIVKKDGKWGGINMQGELVIPTVMDEWQDIMNMSQTVYLEEGRNVVSERSIDKYASRKRGYKSRFSINDTISEEYWDF